jgi:hypothetical protein
MTKTNVLRAAALIVIPAGAVGSIAFVLYAGRHNPSRLLILLFAIWVLSPFVLLAWANVVSARWPALTRAALQSVTLLIALGSLAAYGNIALGPPRAQGAFVFVVVPPASWLVIAAAAWISRRMS